MNTKHMIAGATVVAVLALGSPAYAGLLGGGGAGGGFGGGLGGGLNGMHGGNFGSQGGFNGSLMSPSTSPANKAVTKVDSAKTAAVAAPTPTKMASPVPATTAAPTPPAHALTGSGSGSLDAQHAPGTSTVVATGTASGSIN
jgi:hypothetical protein